MNDNRSIGFVGLLEKGIDNISPLVWWNRFEIGNRSVTNLLCTKCVRISAKKIIVQLQLRLQKAANTLYASVTHGSKPVINVSGRLRTMVAWTSSPVNSILAGSSRAEVVIGHASA